MGKTTFFIHSVTSLNLGDDLFLKILIERYPQARFIMQAQSNYKTILKNYGNCKVFDDTNIIVKVSNLFGYLFHIPQSAFLYLYIILRYHVSFYLVIGGSLFIEGNSTLPDHLKNIKKYKIFRPSMKIVVIGSNYGPSITDKWKKKVGESIKCVDDICFRDKVSYDLFSNYSNVRWGNDIVFHLPVKNTIKKKVLCVNVRSVDKWPQLKPYKEKYLHVTKDIIQRYLLDNYEVKLISFCKQYGDNEITDELYNILQDKEKVNIIYYNGNNLAEIIEHISSAEYMIATRFHAIILSMLFKVKVFPVSYSIKTENMLKTYGIWNELYNFSSYCNSNPEIIKNYFIENFIVNKEMNVQFNFIDGLLDKQDISQKPLCELNN